VKLSKKTIFGDTLSTRLLETQTTQALVRCLTFNRMTSLGMPESYSSHHKPGFLAGGLRLSFDL